MEVQGSMGSLGLGQGTVQFGRTMIQRILGISVSQFFRMMAELLCSTHVRLGWMVQHAILVDDRKQEGRTRVEGTRAVMVFLLSTALEAISHGTTYSQTGE